MAGRHEACVTQRLQVKRQRVRRHADALREDPGGEAVGTGLDEDPVDGEPAVLGKGSKGFDGGGVVHISILLEL